VTVAEATMALKFLKERTGKFVLAGDTNQLGPIRNGQVKFRFPPLLARARVCVVCVLAVAECP
jgi:hypothetical protein